MRIQATLLLAAVLFPPVLHAQDAAVEASVGSSGSSGATALYFELRRNGDPVNPNTWLKK